MLGKLFAAMAMVLLLCAGTVADAASAQKIQITSEIYTIPDVTLINQNGRKIKFQTLIASGKPVLLDFIYGTCTTICPVLSAGFSSFQHKLAPDTSAVQLISISIDPEHDTPEIMKDYLRRFRAKPGWDFLTGQREDIDQVMKAFNAYVPNKMAHYPLTLIKAPASDRWTRIYGTAGIGVLMEEYRKVSSR